MLHEINHPEPYTCRWCDKRKPAGIAYSFTTLPVKRPTCPDCAPDVRASLERWAALKLA